MPGKREIRLTIEFKHNVRQLAKKFRHIKSDLQPLLEQLATGETLVIAFQVLVRSSIKFVSKILISAKASVQAIVYSIISN